MKNKIKRHPSTECFSCCFRQNIPGDAHSRCSNPDPNMEGDRHGIINGWFSYPYNFDPVWKAVLCANYKKVKQ